MKDFVRLYWNMAILIIACVVCVACTLLCNGFVAFASFAGFTITASVLSRKQSKSEK